MKRYAGSATVYAFYGRSNYRDSATADDEVATERATLEQNHAITEHQMTKKPMWMVRADVGGRLFDDFKAQGVVAIG